MSAPSYAPAPSRPIGVSILAFLVGLFGVLWIVLGAFVLAGAAAPALLGAGNVLGLSGVIAGAVILILGLIILGLALGLWHLRLWALVLTLLFMIFEMVSYGLAGRFVSLGFILAALLFIYLLAVSRHFR
ncbi:MAG TPA: hypothetical protein VEH57_00700 [Thermoplasmata archaeon]|jgi:hypothetical protein|nr:hypothetical protein [Thermoplasmata archaeon]